MKNEAKWEITKNKNKYNLHLDINGIVVNETYNSKEDCKKRIKRAMFEVYITGKYRGTEDYKRTIQNI